MPDEKPFKLKVRSEDQPLSEIAKLQKNLVLVGRNWYYFFFTLLVAGGLAYLYNRYALPTYRLTSTLLIEEEKNPPSVNGDDLLEGFGLGGSVTNLDNQIMVLSSRNLTGQAVDELDFEKDYYYKRLLKKKRFYPDKPVEMKIDNEEDFPRNVDFVIKNLGGRMYSIDTRRGSEFDLHATGRFGQIVEAGGIKFRIDLLDDSWFRARRKVYFAWRSRDALIGGFLERLTIEPASKKGTVVTLNLDGTNKAMDMEFMNKYLSIFLNMSLKKKNIKAERTINFIDEQLIGISDSLVITEEKLQQFRSKYKIMDLSARGKSIIEQAVALETEQAQRNMEAEYYDYLKDYLNKADSASVLIAPATMGITDPGLTKLVSDLSDLQAQYYSKSLGDKNPMQNQIAQRLANIKDALNETLKGVIQANSLAINDIKEQIRSLNAQASALPVTERKLLGIERKYELNNELYTFLIEKRAQAEIQKASNVTDNELIDTPHSGNKPLKPRDPVNYLIALLAGLGLPFIFVSVSNNLNQTVRNIEEIRQLSEIPVSGYIPHASQNGNMVLLEKLKLPNAESFRSLRTRIQFFTKEVKSPVILVSSSMSADGKSSTATNLAYVYSLLGEKTVLVDFDLRAGVLHKFFDLENEAGASTWLIGKHSLEEAISSTRYENLDLMPSGPVPPNPSELVSLSKTKNLMELLKERYAYIVIDTSPIGIFSDGFYLASQSDTNLLVVRQNQTRKESLINTLHDISHSEIQSLSIVLNDLSQNTYNYRYALKYR